MKRINFKINIIFLLIFWSSVENQRNYFDWFEKKMNFKNKFDWYLITEKEIRNYGGSGLLWGYNNSLQQALKSIYPNYEWIPWKFHMIHRLLGKILIIKENFLIGLKKK